MATCTGRFYKVIYFVLKHFKNGKMHRYTFIFIRRIILIIFSCWPTAFRVSVKKYPFDPLQIYSISSRTYIYITSLYNSVYIYVPDVIDSYTVRLAVIFTHAHWRKKIVATPFWGELTYYLFSCECSIYGYVRIFLCFSLI